MKFKNFSTSQTLCYCNTHLIYLSYKFNHISISSILVSSPNLGLHPSVCQDLLCECIVVRIVSIWWCLQIIRSNYLVVHINNWCIFNISVNGKLNDLNNNGEDQNPWKLHETCLMEGHWSGCPWIFIYLQLSWGHLMQLRERYMNRCGR